MKQRSWLLWAAIVLLTLLPFWFVVDPAGQPGAVPAFAGADERAMQAIGHIAPAYRPWFEPVFEPASGEVASLLFALQAAIGAGVIGFWIGWSLARERVARTTAQPPHHDAG